MPAAAATIDKVIIGGAASLLPETFGAMGAKPTKHGVNGSHGSQRSLGSPGRGGNAPAEPLALGAAVTAGRFADTNMYFFPTQSPYDFCAKLRNRLFYTK